MSHPGDEKRRFARVPFYGTAEIRVEDQWFAVTLLDLSLKGAQIQTAETLTIATEKAITLKLSLDDSPIELLINAHIQRAQTSILGLVFLPLLPATLAHLRRLLELNLGSEKLFES